MMEACGTTTASLSVRTVIATLTKAPGHKVPAPLSNFALTLTVPEAASTALSTNCR